MVSFLPDTVLALIPARGGSKGVARKNIRPLLGKPLLAWSIETALAAKSIGRVLVSTEDEEIAAIARSYGADVPFMRPVELAQDDTTDLPVLQQVLETLKTTENKTYDAVVWLRPTAPIRRAGDIESMLDVLAKTEADSVRSVSLTGKAHPYWMKTINDGFLHPFVAGQDEKVYPRRQTLPPAYALNGNIDVTRTRTFQKTGSIWGDHVAAYVMPPEHSIDIDTDVDFAIAEVLLKQHA